MFSQIALLVTLANIVAGQKSCYWNAECPYSLYSTKTPYDAVRGDIRDYKDPENCEPLSVWSINRHGNRNPSGSVTNGIKITASLKDEIISSYEAGRGELCAQDIEEFRKWMWNATLETSTNFLSGTGYEELYDIGRRLREKYPQLLNAGRDSFYFRPTNEQRTITSAVAFVHGLTDGTNLDLVVDEVQEGDNVIRPYENCDKYQKEVNTATFIDNVIAEFARTSEYIAVQNRVQQRLGITTQLSTEDIYNIYEICRFYRSWTTTKQSPWCAAFTNEDLVILEYSDDIRHYYRNGYGSWVNVRLGGIAMRDLYENFEASVQGRGKNIVSYFTHDTMVDMVFSALGLYRDETPLLGSSRNASRLWRTSYLSSFSTNLVAVLYRCQEPENHRVQIFHNEHTTDLCPTNGCTWDQFQDKFQQFADATLDFCNLEYPNPDKFEPITDSAVVTHGVAWLVIVQFLIVWFWRS